MQSISLSKFKSYNKQQVVNFNPNINVILGSNGQGKSNLFKAISFVLSDKLQINRTEFNNGLHKGLNVSNDDGIDVQLIIKGKEQTSDSVKVGKVWNSNLNQECYINSKLTSKKQYENFIEGLRLSYTNPYNIVQQGKINQITLMDEFQLYKLLEQVSGAKKFYKRKQQAELIMKKVQIQKHQIKMNLQELNQKLKSLENKKQEFQYFAIQEKTKKYRTKKHCSQLLQSTKHNTEKIKVDYGEVLQSLNKVAMKKKQIEEGLEQANIFIKTAKEKHQFIQKTGAGMQTQYLQSQDYRNLQERQKQLHKQLKQNAKSIRDKTNKINQFKQNFSKIQQSFELIKLNKQLQKTDTKKDKLIQAFTAEILQQQQKIKQINGSVKNLIKEVGQIENFLKSKKVIQNQKQNDRLQREIWSLKQQIGLNKKQHNELIISRGITNVEYDSLREMVSQSQTRLRKFLPNLDLVLLDKLRQLKIRGVYGYFLQFVKIDQNVSFAYEIAGMSKLCSLLVQDQGASMAVIQINQRMRGRQINIIQLDYIRSKPAQTSSAPKSNTVHRLNNQKWIKPNAYILQNYPKLLKEDVQKLIRNSFNKYALVKDYDVGLQVSKEFHINCITNDRQIVYSEGYHCKLGQQNKFNESNIQMFMKIQQKRQYLSKMITQKNQVEERLLNCQHKQIELMNNHQKIQFQYTKNLAFFNQIKTQRKTMEAYSKDLQLLEKRKKDCQNQISRKKQTIKNISQKNGSKGKDNSKFSQAEQQKLQQQYFKKRRQLNKMMTEIFEIEQQNQKLMVQKQDIDRKYNQVRHINPQEVRGPKQIGKEIERGLQQKERLIHNLEKQLQQLNILEKDLYGDKSHLQAKLLTYNAQEQDLEEKLKQIGEIQENIEELQELSNSISVSTMQGRRKNHFSAKDRLFFNKFANILDNFSAYKKTFHELEEAQQKIKTTILRYERDSQDYMNLMSQKFQKQFVDIFTYIVNQGSTQIRLKKISQKIKDTLKYKNCLTIRVNFGNPSEAMKKWSEFSGGEKTIIGITILLALQRCQPAPFYIFDEIDSALDSGYVKKITQLLVRQSQRNKCQYFISSFKDDMTSFPQQICNYYLVQCENRESTIQKINRKKASDVLKTIVMKK